MQWAGWSRTAQPGPALLHVHVNPMQLVMPPFMQVEPAIGMALYSTRAILHGRGGDVWEMVRENVLSLKARCGSASPPIELPRGMRVVKHRCHGQTAIAQLAGAIGCAHSQIFCRCRKRTCGSSTDSRLVFAGAPAKVF